MKGLNLKARFALTSDSVHNCQFDFEIHVVIVIEVEVRITSSNHVLETINACSLYTNCIIN